MKDFDAKAWGEMMDEIDTRELFTSYWRPIEEAPTQPDKSIWEFSTESIRVLGTDGSIVSSTSYCNSSRVWKNESEPEDYGYPGEGGSPGHADWNPTHWMPLPTPPKRNAEGDEK